MCVFFFKGKKIQCLKKKKEINDLEMYFPKKKKKRKKSSLLSSVSIGSLDSVFFFFFFQKGQKNLIP